VSGFVTSFAEGKRIATSALESLPSCPIPEIARLGRTLRAWLDQFLAYFTTERATTEAPKPSTASSNSTAASLAAPQHHSYGLRMILAAGDSPTGISDEPVMMRSRWDTSSPMTALNLRVDSPTSQSPKYSRRR
jgi:hypothetical protein